MNLDEIALAVVKIVHVTPGLLHKHTLNHFASSAAVALSDARGRAELPEYVLELKEKEVLGPAVFPPPAILGFESPLCLIE
jgi:hypothetical protein